MSILYRKTIREALLAKLDGSLTYKGNPVPVFMSRSKNYFQAELPIVAIYLDNEISEDRASAPRMYYRTTDLKIEIVAEEDSDGEDQVLEDIGGQIQGIIDLDPELNEKVDDTILKSTNFQTESEGSRTITAAIFTYDCTYRTDAPDPAVLDDLDISKTEITKKGTNAKIEADVDH